MTNIYTIALTLSSKDGPTVSRKEFYNIVSSFIGESRQYRSDALSLVHSYPIHIQDILVTDYSNSGLIQSQLQLRCDQGCDVNVLLLSIVDAINTTFHSKYEIASETVNRSKHCGLLESSPLCIDSEL